MSQQQVATGLALRLRKAILNQFKSDPAELTQLFRTLSNSSDAIDVDHLKELAEELLEIVVTDEDAKTLYSLYDTNSDGRVSLDDFLAFVNSSSTSASRVLSPINEEAIVDMKISNSAQQDALLVRQGYIQILPDAVQLQGRYMSTAGSGSFGRGTNLWVWRHKQGTCSGRLRPIIDIQLEQSERSSALVISGYTCLTTQIAGQYLWIKRAKTREEEQDAVTDFKITFGKAKVPSDPIWNSPGVGWIRVDGNFNRGIFTQYDSFLWVKHNRTRSVDSLMSSPIRSVLHLSEEARKSTLLNNTLDTLRNFVPVEEMRAVAKHSVTDEETVSQAPNGPQIAQYFDFGSMFFMFGGGKQLTFSRMRQMLEKVGCNMEPVDFKSCFHFFDVNQNGSIKRDEFFGLLELCPDEIDAAILQAKSNIVFSIKDSSKLRINQVFCDIFKLIDANRDGILSVADTLNFFANLNIFITHSEARKILQIMDARGQDRVEELDFVTFMSNPLEDGLWLRRAHRIREAADRIRRWLIRTSSSGASVSSSGSVSYWRELEIMHTESQGSDFPGYVTASDLLVLLAKLGHNMSIVESKFVCMVIAPTKEGHIHQSDLQTFMTSSCRSFGELLAMLERDIMKPVVDAKKELNAAIASDSANKAQLQQEYKEILAEIENVVKSTNKPSTSTGDLVSIVQVKGGIQAVMQGYKTPEAQTPNLEEWSLLGFLSGAVVIEGDFVGFKARDLVEGICNAITTSRIGVRTTFNMDALCKELQGILLEEARRSAVKKGINGTGNQKYDFLSVFSLFDEDHLGSINVDEFRKMLSKLQLIDTLPIDKIPELLRKFDPNNTGSFTLDDLTRFCLDKQYGNFDADDEHAFTDDDDADFSENELPESSSAPTAITQLAEADWLIWALWKNAVSRNSKDPEGVITKIESQCAEVQLASFKAGTVSDKDLWFILSELDMKKGVSKNQFDAGISHFCIDPKAKISGGIDYEWFCRSIIRMGRAFNFMVQQKKKDDLNTYNTLKVELQSELATLVENDIQKVNAVKALKKEDSGNDGSVVKVFRRLDMDGDGKLTVQEFKAALRRLQIKNAKKWTNRLVRRLFEEIDSNKDGRLDISEFLDFIRAKLKSDLGSDPWGVDGAKKKSKNSIDYDDDDRLFNAQRKISDNEIYRKVCATLQESVPNVSKDHVDDVRNAVRKFFQKSDPDDKGYVNEERFRAFCRRSGLQDSLTTSEIQSMMKKLQKPQSGSDAEGAKINYEKFIDEITKSVSGVPHSQGEALLVKLQDAYDEAAYSGRPFLGLCSLIDPKMSGHINRQEVLTAFKMMACPMTMDELKGLLEVLPNNVLEKDDLINYNELNLLLQKHTPRVGASRDTLFAATQPRTQVPPLSTAQLNRTGRPNRRTGALPAYSTPGTTTRPTAAMLRNSGTINTPFGVTISIPQPRQEHLQAHVDTIQEIWTDLQKAIEERTMGRKGRYSLIKQCSVFDPEGSGFIETSSFQSIIDDLGILLSPADLYAIESVYGHPNFDSIDYESFSTSMDEFIKNSGNRGTQRMTITASHMGIAKWITPRILENYRLLRMDGEDPADIFRGLDTDRSGLVSARKFRDNLMRIGLINSDAQLQTIMDRYSSIADSSLISYEDFCGDLELAATSSEGGASRKGNRVTDALNRASNQRSSRVEDDDSAVDDALSANNVKTWYTRHASPKQRRDFDGVFDSLRQFKESNSVDLSSYSRRINGSYTERGDVDESTIRMNAFDRTATGKRYGNSVTDSQDSTLRGSRYRSPSPSPAARRPQSPRSPPGKVGAAMWGSDTPLDRKGKAPILDHNHWLCPVCYYTENSNSLSKCEVCDSANPSSQKDFQIKEQCGNCCFLNGPFAFECEMCGKAIKKR